MTLRLLADHCVSNHIVQSLREAGCDVIRLRDVMPVDSPDQAVIAKAQELGCILLSLNSDFADIVTYPPADYQGIVGLQIKNHPEVEAQVAAMLKTYLAAHPAMGHYRGKLLLVQPHRIRIRE